MDDLTQRVVITGMGIVSAAGGDLASVGNELRRARGCLQPIASFDATGMTMTHAGEVPDFDPMGVVAPLRVRTIDRGTQFALAAAKQAVKQARGRRALLGETTGIAIGLSGAYQYQNLPVTPERTYPVNRRIALYGARSSPAFQADLLARTFSFAGPRVAFGSASLGGLLAVAQAVDLLRAGHAEAMLVGGGEIQTLINALGMDSLGLGAKGPCSPFRDSAGMTFGEGAAFLVLETAAQAEARAATPLGEVLGWGASADAYDDIANDPTGQGLARAIRLAFEHSGVPSSSISWIRSCGTGHRAHDAAERTALLDCFEGNPPPITSTEPYFGHVNGVSPVLGLLAGLATQESGVALAMPPGSTTSPTELPFLTTGPAPGGNWLVTATAFGGTNGALVVGPALTRAMRRRTTSDVAIASIGSVSMFGYGAETFLEGLSRALPLGSRARHVDESLLPKTLPGIDLSRRGRIVRWSLLAAAQAMREAGWSTRGSDRLGLLVGLVRGPLTPYERVFQRILRGELNASIGRGMLKMSRFTVASELAYTLGLRGYCGTICPGVHGGVQLLAQGAELMASASHLDGLLVLAADEWTGLLESHYRTLGLLSEKAVPYAQSARGVTGGEGAVAFLLTRSTGNPGSWANVAGCGFSGDTGLRPDAQGHAYSGAIATSLQRTGLCAEQIDFAIGQGCGWAAHDARELAALGRIRRDLTISSVIGHTGVVESAGGLFGAIAAAGALRDGKLPPLTSGCAVRGAGDAGPGEVRRGDFHHALLIGSNERGAHTAVVLKKAA